MISVLITVSGTVQGVFYRMSTSDKAVELGVKGWVRNMPNGKVLVRAEGNENQVLSLMRWCEKGPQLAFVQHTETEHVNVEHFQDFKILT